MRPMLMTYQLPEAPPPPKLPPPPLKLPLSLDDDPLLQPPDDEPLDQEPPRRNIGERALEAVADLDAQVMVVLGNDEDRAVVDLLTPDLPGLGNADRELLDCLRVCRWHDQHGDLAALARFEVTQLLRKHSYIAARQRAGLVD